MVIDITKRFVSVPMNLILLTLYIFFIAGCSGDIPFSKNDIESKKELSHYLNDMINVADAVKKIEKKGFECSTDIKPWVVDHIPKSINKEPMPYLCRISRTTIPLICSEHWSIYIGHSETKILSTEIKHSGPSCL